MISCELRRFAAIFLFIAVVLASSACSVSVSVGHKKSGFSAKDRADFMNACLLNNQGAKSYCSCAIDRIEATIPADKLQSFANASSGKGSVDAKTISEFNGVELSCSQRTLSAAERKHNVYPEPFKTNFVESCAKSNPGKRKACVCSLRRLEKTTPLAELIAADSALRFSRVANPKTMKKLHAASAACF